MPDNAHMFTISVDKVSPQLYYGVAITELELSNISVPQDCKEVSVYYTQVLPLWLHL